MPGLICDFCSSPSPTQQYPCEDFRLAGLIRESSPPQLRWSPAAPDQTPPPVTFESSALGQLATTATSSSAENTATPWSSEPSAVFSAKIHHLSAYRKTCVFYSTPFSSPGQAQPFRFPIPTRQPLTHI